MFVDPRSHPTPDARRPFCRTTVDPDVLTELHRLCHGGRLYEVEEWIRAGHPLQLAKGVIVKGRFSSALEIALSTQNPALVLLLLCNGYDPNLDPRCPLDLALRSRRWDLLDLLLEWGADPQRVALPDLFDTYRSELFERFREFGVELTANHELAAALAYHAGNKPLFGFAKRHREHDEKIQKDLNIALGHHVSKGNEKGVQLCLWAGADPHAPAPSLRFLDLEDDDDTADPEDRGSTAVEEGAHAGDVRILARLGPDPARDDFDDLYRAAPNGAVVDFLAKFAPPKNVGDAIRSQLFWMQADRFTTPRSDDALRCLFLAGGRWETSSAQETADTRRSLLRLPRHAFVEVMKLLATGEHCSPAIFEQLGRTAAMRARMKEVGFFPPSTEESQRFDWMRPTRSREVLAKFGVVLPKPKPRLPRSVEIGWRRWSGREITIDRHTLFERVWSEPVEKIAKEWGLSGRGLAKACQRARIPVPPRGFWAKAQHGKQVRRPALPKLPAGVAEEVVIHPGVSTSADVRELSASGRGHRLRSVPNRSA